MVSDNIRIKRQAGLALITVLFILVLLTTLSVYMTEDEYLAIRRISNLREAEQAFQVNVSSEQWAAKILERDIIEDDQQNSNQTPINDHLFEVWNQPLPSFEVEDGETIIEIKDEQGLFNLNNLYYPPKVSGANANAQQLIKKWETAYRQLLIGLGLDEKLANTLIDWMDQDIGARLDSADDLDYQVFDPPYRSADQPLTTLGELLLVEGYDEEILEKLNDYVTVLPVNDLANPVPEPVNINTCPALLFHVLSDPAKPMTIEEAEQLVATRDTNNNGWLKGTLFDEASNVVGGQNWNYFDDLVAASSRFFEVTSTVKFGRVQSKVKSLLFRPPRGSQAGLPVKTVRRHRLFI